MNNHKLLIHFPSRILSGNSTAHWRRKAEVKKIEQLKTLEAIGNHGSFYLPDALYIVQRIVFFPPDKRKRDDDNFMIALKAARDTIFAQSDEHDDSQIRLTIIEWGEVCKGGAVGLEFSPLVQYEKERVKDWE